MKTGKRGNTSSGQKKKKRRVERKSTRTAKANVKALLSKPVANKLPEKHLKPCIETMRQGPPTEALSEYELKRQLATEHDARMRELEAQQIATWSEQAEIATLVRQNREWELIEIEVENAKKKKVRRLCTSFNDWVCNACPKSRAHIYAAMGLLASLEDDIPKEDLREIPQTTAKVMKALPSKDRKDPAILKKAKTMQPREFVGEMQRERPDLHIEAHVPRKFHFEASQEGVIDAAIAMADILEAGHWLDQPLLPPEVCLEKICSSWMLDHQAQCEAILNGEDYERLHSTITEALPERGARPVDVEEGTT